VCMSASLVAIYCSFLSSCLHGIHKYKLRKAVTVCGLCACVYSMPIRMNATCVCVRECDVSAVCVRECDVSAVCVLLYFISLPSASDICC
jgi:hypothetical protein